MGFLFPLGIVTIWLISATFPAEGFWTRNKIQSLEKSLFIEILQPVTRLIKNSCTRERIVFDVEEAETATGCCIDNELIPIVRGRIHSDSILRINSTIYLFRHMDNVQKSTFLRENLGTICTILPNLHKCYLVSFHKGYRCLGMTAIIFEMVEMYFQSICSSLNEILGLLDSKYSSCFETYSQIMKKCFKFYERSCGMVKCLRNTFKPCGHEDVDNKLVALFERLDIDGGCKLMELSNFGMMGSRTEPQNAPCIHEELEDLLFPSNLPKVTEFFLKLDTYCAAWNNDTADCRQSRERSQWSRFVNSQCFKTLNPNDPLKTNVEKCKSSSIPARLLQLEDYCEWERKSEELPLLGSYRCGILTRTLSTPFWVNQTTKRVKCEPGITIKTLADNAVRGCYGNKEVERPEYHIRTRAGVLVFVPAN